MKIHFHGAANEVGRSCIVINDKYMLDAGLKITEEGSEYPTMPMLENIKAVFISHAHLDHTGALPLFNYNGLKCSIFCNKMTKALTKILLKDSIHIEILKNKHTAYDEENLWNVLSFMQNTKYNKQYKFGGAKFTFLDASHIPGACSILLEINNKKILYTGDINTLDTNLLLGSNYLCKGVDIMITESTYGDRDHPKREKQEQKFLDTISSTLQMGGSVLIPAFAVGRAQEILLMLGKRRFPAPIYLDGMAKQVAKIFLNYPEYIRNAKKFRKVMEKTSFVKKMNKRKRIIKEQGIFVTTAGMLDGGPVMEYLKHLYYDQKNAILLTGYQGQGTNGRMLLEKGRVFVDGLLLKVKAYVEKFDFSAHSGRKELRQLIDKIKPKHLIINHGDPDSIKALSLIYKKKTRVYVPKMDDVINIK